jgi:hypothetical protein
MYKSIFVNLSIAVLLTSCSVADPKIQLKDQGVIGGYNEKGLDRAKDLYTCGNFFSMVSSVLQVNAKINRYTELSESALVLANSLLAKSDMNSKELDSELSKKYKDFASWKAKRMIRAAGKDATGKLFNLYAKSCEKTIAREDLISVSENLSNRLNNQK